jgi:hypothetical protein
MKHYINPLNTLFIFFFSVQLFAGIGVGYSGVGVLPVELISFTVKHIENEVELNWKTAAEINNYGFEIQRLIIVNQSTINNWVNIGFVKGQGNSNSPKEYFFKDTPQNATKFQYRLKQIDFDGKYKYSDVVSVEIAIPQAYQLNQNFPNPFNPTTVISYKIPFAGLVTLKVYDALGKLVTTLVDKVQEAGTYVINFDGNLLSNGIYFYKIQAGNFTVVKKMLLLK